MNILYSWICDLTSFTPWQHVLHVGLCNFRGVVVSGSLIDCRPKEDTQKGEENVLPMNSHGITWCSMVLENLIHSTFAYYCLQEKVFQYTCFAVMELLQLWHRHSAPSSSPTEIQPVLYEVKFYVIPGNEHFSFSSEFDQDKSTFCSFGCEIAL